MNRIMIEDLLVRISDHKAWLSNPRRGICANLSELDLSNLYLFGEDLSQASICSSNLDNCDMHGTDLSYTNIMGTSLRNANLSGCDLMESNLTGADLSGADMRYCQLSGANLTGCNLTNANLAGAKILHASLPIWSGGRFKADKSVNQLLVQQVLSILELSEETDYQLLKAMTRYAKGNLAEQWYKTKI